MNKTKLLEVFNKNKKTYWKTSQYVFILNLIIKIYLKNFIICDKVLKMFFSEILFFANVIFYK